LAQAPPDPVAPFTYTRPLAILSVSAKTGKNTAALLETLLANLPLGPQYYPDDAVTDQRMREMAAEILREKVLLLTRDEIPHSVAVGLDEFDESNPALIRIKATLFVDQPSQKGMLIGKGGCLIKQLGIDARKDIEALVEAQVYLELNVKVKHHWRRDVAFLKSLGIAPPSHGNA
jgi:GTPase